MTSELLRLKRTPEKIKQVRENFLAMQANIKRAGELILELMRHPDVTPEEVAAAQASYARSYAGFIQVRESLRKAIPPRKGVFTNIHPWE